MMLIDEQVRAVLRYEEKRDEKGKMDWRPVYLKETPKDVIEIMNEQHQEWKTVKQVKYNNDGMKEGE